MPRKAPDGNGVIEHRITLGNYERKTLTDYIEKQAQQALDANLIKTAPVVIVAGGIGVAAYALWRWVGLGSIIDRVSNTWDNIVESGKDAALFAQTGDITATSVGNKVYQDMLKAKVQYDEKYAAKLTELESIKHDTSNSERIRQQAELDIQRLKQQKKGWYVKWNKAMAKIDPYK